MEKLWSHLENAETFRHICTFNVSYIYALGLPMLLNLITSLDEKSLSSKKTGWSAKFVEGKIPTLHFFSLLEDKIFPVNVQLRSKDSLGYVPLRDKFHDSFGHLPFLFSDEQFSNCLHFLAQVYLIVDSPFQRLYLERLYWAVFEFGLIKAPSSFLDDQEEINKDYKIKILGAGLISSPAEGLEALNNTKNTQRQFNPGEILDWAYNPYGFQDRHYIIESFEEVYLAIAEAFSLKS